MSLGRKFFTYALIIIVIVCRVRRIITQCFKSRQHDNYNYHAGLQYFYYFGTDIVTIFLLSLVIFASCKKHQFYIMLNMCILSLLISNELVVMVILFVGIIWNPSWTMIRYYDHDPIESISHTIHDLWMEEIQFFSNFFLYVILSCLLFTKEETSTSTRHLNEEMIKGRFTRKDYHGVVPFCIGLNGLRKKDQQHSLIYYYQGQTIDTSRKWCFSVPSESDTSSSRPSYTQYE